MVNNKIEFIYISLKQAFSRIKVNVRQFERNMSP